MKVDIIHVSLLWADQTVRVEHNAFCFIHKQYYQLKMPVLLESIGRPSFWRNVQFSKVKYVLWSVTSNRYTTSCQERWSVVCSILLTALLMASWMGMDVYTGLTTPRLYWYGIALSKSPSCVHLISSKLFSRCAERFFRMGSRAPKSSHRIRFVHGSIDV